MKEMTPESLPWARADEDIFVDELGGDQVARCVGANALEHADYIVKAVNSHEALVEALKRLVYEVTHLSPMEDDGSHKCIISASALKEARAALAREREAA